jgi:hypothetical protein
MLVGVRGLLLVSLIGDGLITSPFFLVLFDQRISKLAFDVAMIIATVGRIASDFSCVQL